MLQSPTSREQGPEGAIGVWYIPREQVDAVNAAARLRGVAYVGPFPFYYDGQTVTRYLLTDNEWMWRGPDDHYRLKARWHEHELHYRLPFTNWAHVATFQDGRFHFWYGEVEWLFERLTPDAVPEFLKPLVIPREPHDYAINPIGQLDPGWQNVD